MSWSTEPQGGLTLPLLPLPGPGLPCLSPGQAGRAPAQLIFTLQLTMKQANCDAPCPADPWGHSHFPRCSLLSIGLPHAEARTGLLLCQGVSSCSPLEKLGLGCCGFPALSQRALPGPRFHTVVLSEKQWAPKGWGALPLAGGDEADCLPQPHVA